MIKKRLIQIVPEAKKYIAANVVCQWVGLLAGIVTTIAIAAFLQALYDNSAGIGALTIACIAAGALAIRCTALYLSSKAGFSSAKTVKLKLREMIMSKVLRLGRGARDISTAETVQLAAEGADQLETYFGQYLPQFFYSMLAPVFLFAVMCFFSVKTAVILLVCVPLIPMSIVAVQKIAKRLLSGYWTQYAKLGDSFLESLQGLTTLKIYQTDGMMHEKINTESERFRKITMKVLTMQLNSITLMDIFVYGGSAAGIIMAVLELQAGNVDLTGCISIILLSAEFFIPMRRLGSYFHIAMNGMAASDKIFRLLDTPEPEQGEISAEGGAVELSGVHFSYDDSREILHGVDMSFPEHSFTAIVGESGCGKSTIAGILTGHNRGYSGSVTIGGTELSQISEAQLMQTVTLISNNSYIFSGTVRETLLEGCENAADEQLWDALERVRLAEFFRNGNGLDTVLTERGGNLSGGQRQRLALARGILHDTRVYVFDEATSNIDAESEDCILDEMRRMAESRTVIMITHRLANCVGTDNIYALKSGVVSGCGKHDELLAEGGVYADLWKEQSAIENVGGAV